MRYKSDHSQSLFSKLIIPAAKAAVIYSGVSLPSAFARGDEVAGNNDRTAASANDDTISKATGLPEIFREVIGLQDSIKKIGDAEFKNDAFGIEIKKIITQKLTGEAAKELLKSDTFNTIYDLGTSCDKKLSPSCVWAALLEPSVAMPIRDEIDIKNHGKELADRERKKVLETEQFLIVAIGAWEEKLKQADSSIERYSKMKPMYDERSKTLSEFYSNKVAPLIKLEEEIKQLVTEYNNSLKDLPSLKAEQDAQQNRIEVFNNSLLAKDYASHQKHWPEFFAQRPAWKGHLVNFQRNGMLLPIVPEGVDQTVYANEMNRNNRTNKAYNDQKSKLMNDSAILDLKLKTLDDKLKNLTSQIDTKKKELESNAKHFEEDHKKFKEEREIRQRMQKIVYAEIGAIEDRKYEALKIEELIKLAFNRLKQTHDGEGHRIQGTYNQLMDKIRTKYPRVYVPYK